MKFDVSVAVKETPEAHRFVYNNTAAIGDSIGRSKYGAEWEGKIYPSEEKLRVLRPPGLDAGVLQIDVVPYQWADLVRQRQIQPIGPTKVDDSMSYVLNAVALTVNGLIETSDGMLVLHRKKGSAHHNSIHTFGGYVEPRDVLVGLNTGAVRTAVVRELSETSELGLSAENMHIRHLFGTPQGKPSILWYYGTGAVYAHVDTDLTAAQLQEQFDRASAEESADRKLFLVPRHQARKLLDEEGLHPQTKAVVPTILELL